MPPEMERDDEVGAVAAAKYFMALYEWAYGTGELELWDQVSGQTCEFCANTHDAVSGAYLDGARIESTQAQFSDFALIDIDQQLLIYSVRLAYSLPEATHIDATGATLGTIPAESGTLVVDVVPSARGWVLLDGLVGEQEAP
ncbi:DUF6318 family protein [Actinotalea sp.]|uniref:DUF6318 family protein n=1 Tax=Actinotalea sp. TaxID=1872145 RepID=UPI0035687049